jgi:hypothetical protein
MRLHSLNPETPDAYWEVGMIEEDGQGNPIVPELGVRFTTGLMAQPPGPWIAFRVLQEAATQYEDALALTHRSDGV